MLVERSEREEEHALQYVTFNASTVFYLIKRRRLTGAQNRFHEGECSKLREAQKVEQTLRPDMLSGIPESVEYVQKSDDSRNSAIRIAYRNSLRPSS